MFGSRDLGIDLGTANSLIYVRNQGIVLREPSVVALDVESRSVLAVGLEAQHMVGRTPGNIVAIRPMRDGVIADFDITEKMLVHFIARAKKMKGLVRFRLVVGVPSGSTTVEKRAVVDAALSAGARDVKVIEEAMAAAIGAGLPVHEPRGSMIVDIGGGTTDIAVISLGGMVVHSSLRIAGDKMDAAIVQHVRRAHNVLIGERTAEQVKSKIGSAQRTPGLQPIEVGGRDLVRGLPIRLTLHPDEIREALAESVEAIVEAVKSTIERTPPELVSDVLNDGIVLAGGGSLLAGLADLITRETNVPARVCDNPLDVVATGTGRALEMLDLLKRSNSLVS